MRKLTLVVGAAIIWLVMVMIMVLMSVNKESNMANTIVTVTPSAPVVSAGQNFTVTVSVAPGLPIAGMQIDLSFNPQAMRIDSQAEGNLFKQGGAGTYFLPGTIDNVNGTVKSVVGTILGAGQNVTTAGNFVVFNCTALLAGKNSTLNLVNVIVGSPAGQPVPLASFSIIQIQVASLWDLNFDGKVDINDVKIVGGVFGQTGVAGWIPADINKDGIVNVLDLIVVGQNFA